ncbi:MAG: TonB-dependent receptor, partial [Deltaproteobacteria bacterium]|nr:TonB-dependent receptor [Deltaproteobacteria bacterium]
AGLELRGDRFRDRDLNDTEAMQIGTRVGGALLAGFDLSLAPELVVTPAFRLDALRSQPTPMSGTVTVEELAPRWDVVPSPRLSARSLVTSDVAIKGSAGWYARLPTLLEVFGNRGYIVGTPDLEPERGPSVDLGAVWAPEKALGEVDRILVAGNLFANRAHDTIAIINYAGFVARAENIGTTQGYGAELVASGRLAKTVSVTASYTRLVTEQISNDVSVDGKAVPRRPGHVLYARTDVVRTLAGRVAAVWLDGTWQAESALDAANRARVPGRLLLGSGARVEIAGGLAVAISITNLTDDRVAYVPLDPAPSPALTQTPTPLTDVAGFPLPGRSYYLSLDWTH